VSGCLHGSGRNASRGSGVSPFHRRAQRPNPQPPTVLEPQLPSYPAIAPGNRSMSTYWTMNGRGASRPRALRRRVTACRAKESSAPECTERFYVGNALVRRARRSQQMQSSGACAISNCSAVRTDSRQTRLWRTGGAHPGGSRGSLSYRRGHQANSIAPMRELRPGVWHWQSPRPAWGERWCWPELVSSYGIEVGDEFLLFDPLCVPDQLRERATAVVLTAPYHESDDLAWLRLGDGEGHVHGPGPWPFGISAYAGREDNDLILWLPSINAIVTGDSLSDFGAGLDIQLGARKHVTREDVLRRIRSLLELPVELVLPAHGKPQDRAALERVLR
jgi:hypothetical protein